MTRDQALFRALEMQRTSLANEVVNLRAELFVLSEELEALKKSHVTATTPETQ